MFKKQENKKNLMLIFLLFFVSGGIFFPNIIKADKDSVSIYLDINTLQKGYTIDKPDGKMRLAIFPGVLDRPANITLKKSDAEGLTMPEDLKLVSDIMEFDIITDPIKIFAKEAIVVLNYDSDNQKQKRVFFYDGNWKSWRPLYSQTNYEEKWVRAYTHLPYSKVAVFEDDKTQEGYASWYTSYSHPYGCASNDFPFDMKLRVTNLDDGRQVVCQVKSTGPYDPARIIDLSLTAFEKIAPRWKGLVKVKVEPAEENEETGATSSTSEKTEVENKPVVQGIAAPSLSASVAMIYDAPNRKVIYEKNSHLRRSIASITKMMTTIIFLETNPDFEKVITIEEADMPRPESGVKIAVGPGDQITVRSLFNAMITGSANNATLALVRSTGLSREEFVARMNKKAVDLDMMSTKFVEPTGLGVGNISTSTDVSLMFDYIMNRPGVRNASIQHSYTYTIINTGEQRTIRNPLFLYTDLLAGQPIAGAKTGFINEAGYCLVTKVRVSDGREFTAVILGSPSAYTRASDMKNLLEYGLKVF